MIARFEALNTHTHVFGFFLVSIYRVLIYWSFDETSLVLITFSFLMKNDVKTKVFLKEFKNLVS